MDSQHVTVEHRGPVALVTFGRHENRNALSLALIQELTRTAEFLAEDAATQAIVLTGSGDVFSAGLDLKDKSWHPDPKMTIEDLRVRWRRGTDLCAAWEALPQPTVAAIEGYAVGGGLALAVALDWRVAARGAFVTLPEIEIGLNLGWGALPRLTALVGPARAKRAAVLCDRLDADTAATWGLVDEVCEDGGALAKAMSLAETAAAMPTAPARMAKATVNAVAHALAPLATHRDGDQSALVLQAPEYAEIIAAFQRRGRS